MSQSNPSDQVTFQKFLYSLLHWLSFLLRHKNERTWPCRITFSLHSVNQLSTFIIVGHCSNSTTYTTDSLLRTMDIEHFPFFTCAMTGGKPSKDSLKSEWSVSFLSGNPVCLEKISPQQFVYVIVVNVLNLMLMNDVPRAYPPNWALKREYKGGWETILGDRMKFTDTHIYPIGNDFIS